MPTVELTQPAADTRSDWTRFRYEFTSALWLAWDSIRAHKLRSFLTLLGVIIGVASVILVGSAIDGLGVYAQESTAKAFGSESFMVAQIAAQGRMTRKELFNKIKYNKRLMLADERYLESVNNVTPSVTICYARRPALLVFQRTW